MNFQDVLGGLQCSCGGSLAVAGSDALDCTRCKLSYPVIGQVPWLFCDARRHLAHWRTQRDIFIAKQSKKILLLKESLAAVVVSAGSSKDRHGSGVLALSRKRLEKMISDREENLRSVMELLSPLGPLGPRESENPIFHMLPVTQSIESYFENILRDWAWHHESANEATRKSLSNGYQDENKITMEFITTNIDAGVDKSKLLILGAGSGRLAFDLHNYWGTSASLWVDTSPLMLAVSRKILARESVYLGEFPRAPKSMGDSSKLWECRAPLGADCRNFYLAAMDVSSPHLKSKHWPTIVTPWLIDIIAESLPDFLRRISSLLPIGGHWIQFGSFVFDRGVPENNWGIEQLPDLMSAAGFELIKIEFEEVPYLRSPLSCQHRRERVNLVLGKKIRDVEAPDFFDHRPACFRDGKIPVSMDSGFETMKLQSAVTANLLSLVDGRRSIEEIGRVLSKNFKMSPEDAEDAVSKILMSVLEKKAFQ